jgi:hypothetical protein
LFVVWRRGSNRNNSVAPFLLCYEVSWDRKQRLLSMRQKLGVFWSRSCRSRRRWRGKPVCVLWFLCLVNRVALIGW